LEAPKEDSRDPDKLKDLGLQAMAPRYRFDSAVGVIMGQRIHTPKYWRHCADETLTLAEQITDPECKRMLVGVAETYAKLARRAAATEAARAERTRQRGRS
jgi:hypothetical protein